MSKLVARSRRMPSDALFSGHTAAWLHGLDVAPCNPIEVTLPQRSVTSHLAGVSLTRSDFSDAETCLVAGLPVTTITRTRADLGRRLPLTEGVVILDIALRRRLVTLDELNAWMTVHPRHRRIRRLQQAMELADAASESPMETRLRVLLVSAGLPKPCVQAEISDGGTFIARVDLLYPEQWLVIEYDGATHRASVAADNRRQNRLIDAGYRILRFTGSDIVRTPAALVGQVRRALAANR